MDFFVLINSDMADADSLERWLIYCKNQYYFLPSHIKKRIGTYMR